MDPQQKNNGFGPISKRRGKSATIAAAIILVVLVLPYVTTIFLVRDKEENKDDFFFFTFVTSRLLLSFIIGKVLQTMYLFARKCSTWILDMVEDGRSSSNQLSLSVMEISFSFSCPCSYCCLLCRKNVRRFAVRDISGCFG